MTSHDHRGEEPGAQEKWMKATCTEAVYLSLGEAAVSALGFLGDEKWRLVERQKYGESGTRFTVDQRMMIFFQQIWKIHRKWCVDVFFWLEVVMFGWWSIFRPWYWAGNQNLLCTGMVFLGEFMVNHRKWLETNQSTLIYCSILL